MVYDGSESNDTDSEEKSPFTEPCSERHAISRANKTLPKSPRRNIAVLQNLNYQIMHSSLVMSKGIIVQSLAQKIDTAKYTGGQTASRRTAHNILKDVVNKTDKYSNNNNFFNKQKNSAFHYVSMLFTIFTIINIYVY